MSQVLSPIQRSLTRAILREARILQTKGPNAGYKVPAIYDMCRTVNPSINDGIILQNSSELKVYISKFQPFTISSEFGTNLGKLRSMLPQILEHYEKESQGKHIPKMTEAEMRCPFEILRAFKTQTLAEETSSRTAVNGLIMQAITGYNPELSENSPGENIYSYNLMFSNVSREPMRIVGHVMRFKNKEKEFRVKKKIGLSDSNLPVILPGQHFICGSTVAFPENLSDNIFLEGEFDVIEEGYRGREFESMELKKQHEILTKETDNEVMFKVKMGETRFRKEILCDNVTKAEDMIKEGVVTETEISTGGWY